MVYLGLIGRDETPPSHGLLSKTITGPEPGWTIGVTHTCLDRRIAFCGLDVDLVEHIDTFLGPAGDGEVTLTVARLPSVFFAFVSVRIYQPARSGVTNS